MEKFYKVIDEKIKKEYEEIQANKNKLNEAVRETCNKFGIEAESYYITTRVLQMDFTDNDYNKFKGKITKSDYFKKNSDVHKFFIQKVKDIGRVRNLDTLDFNLFIYGRYKQKIFKYENELYYYINFLDSDFNEKIKGMEEINLSKYYEMLAEALKKSEKGE